MDTQRSLFANELERPLTTARARRSDPPTSGEAATKHNKTGKTGRHARKVLAYLKDNSGETAAEIGAGTGLGHIEAQRRLSDLWNAGHVVKGVPRRCGQKGSRMVTWGLKRET